MSEPLTDEQLAEVRQLREAHITVWRERDDFFARWRRAEAEVKRLRKTLERMATADAVELSSQDWLDEWTEADAFHALQGIARKALGQEEPA